MPGGTGHQPLRLAGALRAMTVAVNPERTNHTCLAGCTGLSCSIGPQTFAIAL